MSKKVTFLSGIGGVLLFIITVFIASLQYENYNHFSQLISELTETGSPHGNELRGFGYFPSGVLLTIFSFSSIRIFPKSNYLTIGFIGLGLFYGIATIIISIFPCDKGCILDIDNPSISQFIHSLTGLATYIFVPVSLLLIGLGFRKFKLYKKQSTFTLGFGILSLIFVTVFLNYNLVFNSRIKILTLLLLV